MNLGKALFPAYPPSRRRKELQHLKLALFLGLFLCGIIGLVLYILNLQGRI
jgi:hypothetical protein